MFRIVLFTLVLIIGLNVSAEEMAVKPLVAVVDIQKIVEESKAAKKISEKVKDKREQYQKEVTDEEESLRKQDKDLLKQKEVLSDKAFEQKAKDFRNRVVEAQKMVQARRSLLEKAYAESMEKIRDKTVAIIESIAKKRGFVAALPKSQVLFAVEGSDISDEVLEKLNDELPSVKVSIKD